jgi:hypothetical protein
MDNSTRLFGRYTKQDWLNLRAKIIADPNNINNWKKAINLLEERLKTRHFRPIDKILRMRITTGEGFAVMILICSLIEFLQSCYEGKTFKYRASETKSVYGDSAKKFKDFLIQHEPFKVIFLKSISRPIKRINNYADDFYSHVRCGLLHEAATNNGWIIKTHKSADTSFEFVDLSDENRKIIYRDKFVKAIKKYCDNYAQQIIDNKKDKDNQFLRDNFCRKLDSLCMIKNDILVKWWK